MTTAGLNVFFRHYKAHASVILLCMSFIVLLWTALFVQLGRDRSNIIENQLQQNSKLARVFEEHVVRSMRAAELMLLDIVKEYQRSGAKFDIVSYAKSRSIHLDPTNVLSIIDEKGDLILSNPHNPRKMNFKKNSNYQYHAQHDASRIFISESRLGATSKKWTMYLSTRIDKPDGSFGGLASVGMDPTYFSKVYSEINLGKDSVVALTGRDGIVRVRQADEGRKLTAGENVSNTSLFTKHLPTSNHGSYISGKTVDGIQRLLSYRALEEYPLVVLVGTSMATALVAHNTRKLRYIQTAGITTLIILGLGLFALIQITKLDRANEKRRQSEQLFRNLAITAPVGIFRTNIAGKCVYVNDHWCEITGMSATAASGDGWSATLHPDDRERVFREWATAASHQQPFSSEYRFQKPNGAVTWVVGQARAETDLQGATIGYVGTITDITARKHAEDALRGLNIELEQRVFERTAELASANKELETFNYSVAHDLRAPLRGIDGYSRLLLLESADRLDDNGRDFLQNIVLATQHMSKLIDDLLAYSRLERSDIEIELVDMQTLIDSLLADNADEIKARGVVMNVELACSSVKADREGLTMALRNLLENALKFTRNTPKSAIEISGRDTGTACIVAVRDNGTGFDMEFHDRIFAIFQRLHRSEEYPGTGVGLAIVKKAMERMGGRAWAESAPGKGATFYLEIPK